MTEHEEEEFESRTRELRGLVTQLEAKLRERGIDTGYIDEDTALAKISRLICQGDFVMHPCPV